MEATLRIAIQERNESERRNRHVFRWNSLFQINTTYGTRRDEWLITIKDISAMSFVECRASSATILAD